MRTLWTCALAHALVLTPCRAGGRANAQTAGAAGDPTIVLADSTSVPMELPDDRAIVSGGSTAVGPTGSPSRPALRT